MQSNLPQSVPSHAAAAASSGSALFGSYSALPGVFDESFAADGSARPEWAELLQRLEQLGEVSLRKRWQQAQAQIERDGVTFHPHGSSGIESRPWMLDAVPMVITESEWTGLATKLSERAQILEALLRDLFGRQTLLKDKVLPPEVLFGHPGWYPSYQQLYRDHHRYLTYCVTDLARSADGTWRAVGDRTRAPFGLGYVLENRIVTSRMLSSIFRELPVQRLAGFYATLKEQLRRLAPRFRDNPRIVLWTKGPQSQAYFEDSYLARYLGYTLAEGDDLAVRNGHVQLLTLGGLLPVEVLLRRLDDDDCDSVELNPQSVIGISGLLDVLRAGRVAVANSLGSRLAESPVFQSFFPQIARHLLGLDPQLPAIRTWWCGDPSSCTYVLSHLDELAIRPAFRMSDSPPVLARELSAKERQNLIDRIRHRPEQFVGQEIPERSTTPVLTETGIVPWYVGLRTFLVSHARDGFRILPGGLARVSPESDRLNSTMTAGERTQDVWILSEGEVEKHTLLEPPTAQMEPRRSGSELPSRVADNFFWLGRYAERSEQTCRLLQTLITAIDSEESDGPEIAPLLRTLINHGLMEADLSDAGLRQTIRSASATLCAVTLGASNAMSLRSSVTHAVRTANRVRDRISPDMWRAIDRMGDRLIAATAEPDARSVDLMNLLDHTLADLSCVAGLVDEGMTRTLGWRFMDLGRRAERCWQSAVLLRSFFCGFAAEDPETLEALLSVGCSLITYRNRYMANFQIPVALDLLLTDTTNPRSIIYQLSRICEHLEAMPRDESRPVLSAEQRIAISLTNQVRLVDVYELAHRDPHGQRPQLHRMLTRIEEQLPRMSDALTSRFLIHAGLPRHFASSGEAKPRGE
ncbi:MAG: circularly permuted type 2 ATP-grasp protein [Planctomycetaceae bacterium]|nr:circularly permuted type 2 ATP-grasp protein [Planctomycetaceae bacterium]